MFFLSVIWGRKLKNVLVVALEKLKMSCKVKKCEKIPSLKPNGEHYVRCDSCTFHHLCVVCGKWAPKFWDLTCLEEPFCYTCGKDEKIRSLDYKHYRCLDTIKKSWYYGRGYLKAMKAPSNGRNDDYTCFRGRKMWKERHPNYFKEHPHLKKPFINPYELGLLTMPTATKDLPHDPKYHKSGCSCWMCT